PNSYGFRKERSPADAMAQCYLLFRRKHFTLWILHCDIRACFDEISHEWLVKHIPMDKAILQQWLKAGFLEKQVFHRTEAGTPQGGVASPVLANLTLDGLEKVLRQKYPKTKPTDPAKVHMVRYADDILVTGTTQRLLETEVKPLVEEFLK